jgi:hypothetical protein
MTDEKEQTVKPKDITARDMAIRTQALDWAIRANTGLHYDDTGRALHDERLIVEAAAEFENYIKNGKKPITTENLTETQLDKLKDEWK